MVGSRPTVESLKIRLVMYAVNGRFPVRSKFNQDARI